MYGPEILDLFDLLGPFSLGATAESWAQDGCRRGRFLRYPYIRDCSWCSRDVTDMMSQAAQSQIIRGSLISVILAGVPLTLRKWCCSRRQSHPPQCRIPYSSGCLRHVTAITWERGHMPQRDIPHYSSCFCDLQEITFLQTTVACSYSECVALSVMRTIRRDVNGIHVSTIRNLIRREGSD